MKERKVREKEVREEKMKLSKKMKKQVKENVLKSLVVLATVTTTIAVTKLTGVTTSIDQIGSLVTNRKGLAESDSLETRATLSSDFSTLAESLDNSMVAAGNTFGVVLKPDGSVWTWGNNTYGQLGNGNVANVSIREPARVVGINGEGIGYYRRLAVFVPGALPGEDAVPPPLKAGQHPGGAYPEGGKYPSGLWYGGSHQRGAQRNIPAAAFPAPAGG